MKKSLSSLLTTLILMAAVSTADAARVLTPEQLSGGEIITPQAASKLSGTIYFYDMRKALNYAKGHVAGAVSLPFKPKSQKRVNFDHSLDTLNLSQLPEDRSAPVIFYSDGKYGWKSYKAAVIAIKSGFKRVYWMRDGFSGWKKSGLTVTR